MEQGLAKIPVAGDDLIDSFFVALGLGVEIVNFQTGMCFLKSALGDGGVKSRSAGVNSLVEEIDEDGLDAL